MEGKTDAEKKAIVDKKLADKDAAEAAKAGGAPEKYDVKLPEGFEKDEPVMAKFLDIARKFNLSNDKAQELVDFQAEVERSRADAADAEFNSRAKAWREETVKNSGKNFEADQADVGRFVETFGGPGLRKLMDATRIGENWELFSAMAKAGAKLKEAQPPEGGANGKEPDQGKRWYGEACIKPCRAGRKIPRKSLLQGDTHEHGRHCWAGKTAVATDPERQDPDIAEMDEVNPVLGDIPMVPGNQGSTHMMSVRDGIPDPTFRRLNRGTP